MKTVQIIDGADNATFSLFRATDEEFRYLFPGEGQDLELVEDFYARHHPDFPPQLLASLWSRPVHKRHAEGVDGTLFFDYAGKRGHLPASKREIDRAPSQLNPATRELYEQLRAEQNLEGASPLPATTADLLGQVQGARRCWTGSAAAPPRSTTAKSFPSSSTIRTPGSACASTPLP